MTKVKFYSTLFDQFDEVINSFTPLNYNYKKNENEHIFELAVPSLSKENVILDVEDNKLTISFDKEYKEGETKFFNTSSKNTYNLPNDVDVNKINAKVENGVLTIIMPKTNQTKKKNIQIT